MRMSLKNPLSKENKKVEHQQNVQGQCQNG